MSVHSLSFRYFISVGMILLLLTPTPVFAQAAKPNLPDVAQGEAAIAALGNRLPAVANENAMSAEDLRKLLLRDESLWVDATDKLFYVEPALSTEGATSETMPAEAPAQNNYLPSDAFSLNSKPDSSKTIYLDFDGHLISNTVWNSSLGGNFSAPAFDLDGSPSSFSDTERNRIIAIWKRVAEDFAPFDVNVTTEDPGEAALTRSSSSDEVYGTRALISKTNAVCGNCGGYAYLGIFDSTNSAYYQPAWVFYDALGNGNEKYVAEAISHEVGHNGGLSHDGTSSVTYYRGHGSGETGWAPIMGSSYYKEVTQWSKGEYTGANNTQDDFAIMSSNGILTRSDDHGDTRASASYINQGSSFSVQGIIEDRNDVDYFSIYAGPGEVTINASEHTHGPNLDIELRIFDSNGNLLGQANPATLLEAGLVFSVTTEGTYFIQVDGVGFSSPEAGYSDYSSLGYYSLSGTLVAGSGNQPPQAVAEASTLSGTAPLTVSFSGTNSSDTDGTIVSHTWDLGDGNTASGETTQHTFLEGTYIVTLTVIDDDGASSQDTLTVVVEADSSNNISAPSNLTATVSGSNVALSWSDTSNNEDGFLVHRGLESGKGRNKTVSWSLIANLPTNSTSYQDSGLADGTYLYRVEAFHSTNSASSSEVKVNLGRRGGGGKKK